MSVTLAKRAQKQQVPAEHFTKDNFQNISDLASSLSRRLKLAFRGELTEGPCCLYGGGTPLDVALIAVSHHHICPHWPAAVVAGVKNVAAPFLVIVGFTNWHDRGLGNLQTLNYKHRWRRNCCWLSLSKPGSLISILNLLTQVKTEQLKLETGNSAGVKYLTTIMPVRMYTGWTLSSTVSKTNTTLLEESGSDKYHMFDPRSQSDFLLNHAVCMLSVT